MHQIYSTTKNLILIYQCMFTIYNQQLHNRHSNLITDFIIMVKLQQEVGQQYQQQTLKDQKDYLNIRAAVFCKLANFQ